MHDGVTYVKSDLKKMRIYIIKTTKLRGFLSSLVNLSTFFDSLFLWPDKARSRGGLGASKKRVHVLLVVDGAHAQIQTRVSAAGAEWSSAAAVVDWRKKPEVLLFTNIILMMMRAMKRRRMMKRELRNRLDLTLRLKLR